MNWISEDVSIKIEIIKPIISGVIVEVNNKIKSKKNNKICDKQRILKYNHSHVKSKK